MFALIRLLSGERLAAKERITKAVVESAVSAGKPKKLLDQMRNVRKTRARFQASAANVVEAFAAANACPGSVLGTTPINREQATATARLLANVGRRTPNIDHSIRLGSAANCGVPERRSTLRERPRSRGERSTMCRENRRNLNFTFNFIDDESRPRFHCCFMFTASSGKIALRFGKFTCITGGRLVRATAVYAPVVASASQITLNRGPE